MLDSFNIKSKNYLIKCRQVPFYSLLIFCEYSAAGEFVQIALRSPASP